jgi:hypothetical protein
MNRIALIAAVVTVFVAASANAGSSGTTAAPVAEHLKPVPVASANDANQAGRTRSACSSIWTCWF